MEGKVIDLLTRKSELDAPQPVNEGLVALVESLLESVKAGETIGLLMVGLSQEGHAMSAMHIPEFEDSAYTASAVGILTGTIDRLKHRVYAGYEEE